jgi:hypothetical protein
MRPLFLVPLLSIFLLTGCNALFPHNGDDFEHAGTNPFSFEADAQACGVVANDFISYDLKGMGGTNYDRNRAFNSVYDRCMTGRGHAPRAPIENWLAAG